MKCKTFREEVSLTYWGKNDRKDKMGGHLVFFHQQFYGPALLCFYNVAYKTQFKPSRSLSLRK